MNRYEIIISFTSCFSLIISILAYINSFNNKKISQGQIELQLHQHICQSENNLLNIMIKEKDFDDKETFIKVLNTALQFNLNAYEEACAKYIDNKVDKSRFKKSYYASICNIVKSGLYDALLDTKKTNFHALLTVYEEWINLEK